MSTQWDNKHQNLTCSLSWPQKPWQCKFTHFSFKSKSNPTNSNSLKRKESPNSMNGPRPSPYHRASGSPAVNHSNGQSKSKDHLETRSTYNCRLQIDLENNKISVIKVSHISIPSPVTLRLHAHSANQLRDQRQADLEPCIQPCSKWTTSFFNDIDFTELSWCLFRMQMELTPPSFPHLLWSKLLYQHQPDEPMPLSVNAFW